MKHGDLCRLCGDAIAWANPSISVDYNIYDLKHNDIVVFLNIKRFYYHVLTKFGPRYISVPFNSKDILEAV